MKDFLDLWLQGLPTPASKVLPKAAVGEGRVVLLQSGRPEFAEVRISVAPAGRFECVDNVSCKRELESLRVGWPDSVVMGVLDELMLNDRGPFHEVRLVLEDAAYHDADSTVRAFVQAGREAARKIIAAQDLA